MIRKQDIKQGGNDIAADHEITIAMHGEAMQACRQQRYAARQGRKKSEDSSGQVKQEGHRADALALRADERRDKLRKAAGRGTYPSIRGCLNGGTHIGRGPMYLYANT